MSTVYNVFSEPYIRFSNRLNKLIKDDAGLQKSGRKPPLVPRPSEEFVIPQINSAFESLAFYTMLVYKYPENDYALSKVVNHMINTADKYNYQGDWKIWLFAALYFNLEVVDERSNETINEMIRSFSEHNVENNKTSSLDTFDKMYYEREGTIFSDLYWFEFIQLFYSMDTIFGNLIKLSLRFYKIVRIKDPMKPKYSRSKIQKLKTSEYKDKGSLPDPVSRARRLANVEQELRRPKFDSMNLIALWGHERLQPSEGGD